MNVPNTITGTGGADETAGSGICYHLPAYLKNTAEYDSTEGKYKEKAALVDLDLIAAEKTNAL